MTNQELIANLDIDQKTGKISFEQWWAMKSGVKKLVMDSVEIDAGELETGYTEAEENCKGCMGPCGRCGDAEAEKVVRWAHGIADSLSKNTSFSEEEQEVFATVRDGVIKGVMERLEKEMDVAQSDYDEGGSREREFTRAAGRLIEEASLKKRIRELEEALRMGIEMRDSQKTYFRTREGSALDAARAMERAFDKTAAAVMDTDEVTIVKGYGEMPTLFPT